MNCLLIWVFFLFATTNINCEAPFGQTLYVATADCVKVRVQCPGYVGLTGFMAPSGQFQSLSGTFGFFRQISICLKPGEYFVVVARQTPEDAIENCKASVFDDGVYSPVDLTIYDNFNIGNLIYAFYTVPEPLELPADSQPAKEPLELPADSQPAKEKPLQTQSREDDDSETIFEPPLFNVESTTVYVATADCVKVRVQCPGYVGLTGFMAPLGDFHSLSGAFGFFRQISICLKPGEYFVVVAKQTPEDAIQNCQVSVLMDGVYTPVDLTIFDKDFDIGDLIYAFYTVPEPNKLPDSQPAEGEKLQNPAGAAHEPGRTIRRPFFNTDPAADHKRTQARV